MERVRGFHLQILTALIAMMPPFNAYADVFISEYVEGTSLNKALEIYNGNAASVDLGAGAYQIEVYFNGNTAPGTTINLTGTLPAGGVYVVSDDSASAPVLAVTNQTTASSLFNGDDAIVLRAGGVVIDSIGQVGVDPGAEWGSGDASTRNNTLRRLASIASGDADPFDIFDPASEWQGFPLNSFDNLGSYAAGSGGGVDAGNCGDSATLISGIQGAGDVSPQLGNSVVIEAVVVGEFQGGTRLNGFFVQEEDTQADTDLATSEGIFVFDSAQLGSVSVGDQVRVAGTVQEFNGLTELASISQVKVCNTGVALPAAVIVNLPVANIGDLERREGMRITLPQALTVSGNYNLGRFGQVALSNGRLFIPTNVVAPGAAALALQADNDRNRLLLDDGFSAQNVDPIVFPAPGLTALNTLRSGDTVANISGVLDYAFGEYRVQPTLEPAFNASNARAPAPGLPAGDGLRVASFNVLNYFNGDGLGGGFPTSRGADNASELARQQDKIVAALASLDADIIGLIEIENDGYGPNSAIAQLTAALNGAVVGSSFAFINPGVAQIGTDAIAVGFIYRVDAVTPLGNAAILDSSIAPLFIDSKNRPALAQSFREAATAQVLTVAVNHFKSKGSACDDVGDPDIGDGQGNCNQTRTRAALALVNWLATDPTGSLDDDFLIIGDLNAYGQEDPIQTIKGAGYTNLIEALVSPADAYSFVFRAQAGYLDQALASTALVPQVSGATIWHINADEPRVLDYNEEFKSAPQVQSLYGPDVYRSSDHDPVVIDLHLITALDGDLDNDGDIDRDDINIILAVLNTPAVGPNDVHDINNDGLITLSDARALVTQCTRTRCSTS